MSDSYRRRLEIGFFSPGVGKSGSREEATYRGALFALNCCKGALWDKPNYGVAPLVETERVLSVYTALPSRQGLWKTLRGVTSQHNPAITTKTRRNAGSSSGQKRSRSLRNNTRDFKCANA